MTQGKARKKSAAAPKAGASARSAAPVKGRYGKGASPAKVSDGRARNTNPADAFQKSISEKSAHSPAPEKKSIVNWRKSILAVFLFALLAFALWLLSRNPSLDINASLAAAYTDMTAGRYEDAVRRLDRAADSVSRELEEFRSEERIPHSVSAYSSYVLTREDEQRLSALHEAERRIHELRKQAELEQASKD